jgi:hypothetical protein
MKSVKGLHLVNKNLFTEAILFANTFSFIRKKSKLGAISRNSK